MAGHLRYLDSREDEQERQITMKASSISVLYGHKVRQKPSEKDKPAEIQQHLINIIDSPGHIDFSIEVSSAVNLSDGALVLIDCIEGVSP